MQLHLQNQPEPTVSERGLSGIPLRLRQLYPHSFNIDSQRWQTPMASRSLKKSSAPLNSQEYLDNSRSKQASFSFANAFYNRLLPQSKFFCTSQQPASPPKHHSPTAAAVKLQPSMSRPQRIFLVGGWLVSLFTIAINLGGSEGGRVNASATDSSLCQNIVQPNGALSRAQLAQVLTIPERSPRSDVREQLAQPYCQLNEIEMRAGVTAQREAYPLAFDPQTWLILLFEEDEYAGYAFQF